jgi:hypothetical protein
LLLQAGDYATFKFQPHLLRHPISFIGSTIGGDLDCEKGVFTNPDDFCFNAAGATIKGRVFLRSGFQATGEVNLAGASVGNIVDCSRGTFTAGTRSGAVVLQSLLPLIVLALGAVFDGPLSVWRATVSSYG